MAEAGSASWRSGWIVDNGAMRVDIDRDLCLESGQCAYMQPLVFELDDGGTPHVKSVEFGDAERQAAEDAAELCPSQAIVIHDD